MQKFGLQRTAGPVEEPITLDQAKAHLRVDYPDEDALITSLITVAREYAENYTNRVLFPQTWQLSLDQFPYQSSTSTITPASRDNWLSFGGYIEAMQIQLPVPRVQAVIAIAYQDADGNGQTLDPSAYNVDTRSEPARILPVGGGTWPYPAVYVSGTVTIDFLAGSYTADTCPASIKQAMLMLIAGWFNQRESITAKPLTAVPMAVDCLLSPYKFYGVIV